MSFLHWFTHSVTIMQGCDQALNNPDGFVGTCSGDGPTRIPVWVFILVGTFIVSVAILLWKELSKAATRRYRRDNGLCVYCGYAPHYGQDCATAWSARNPSTAPHARSDL